MTETTTTRSWLGLILAVGGCLLAGALGAWATASSVTTWYPGIAKPAWTPPDAAFGPVWTALYIMMGISAWLVWRRAGWNGGRGPLMLFALQLVLNTTWSFLFFGLQRPGLAALEIVVLWLAIIATLIAFARIDRLAGALLVPYLAWASFACALNFTIWRMNA